LDSVEALDRIAAEWNALTDHVPFRSFEWATAWWRHYRPAQAQLFVLAVHDSAGRLVGLAPWYRTRSAGWGQTVQFIGSGDVCSEYLSLLCDRPDARRVSVALTQWLTDKARREWDVLDLPAIDALDEALGQLRDQFVERNHAVDCEPDARCWRVSLPETWNDFLAGFSKSRRDRNRYLLRRHLESGRARLLRAVDSASLERGFEIFIDLHQKRREMLGQAGCFASAEFAAFHRQVAQQFLDSGRLRLVWLELEGRPLAVEYSFVGGDTVYYYQGGFEPELSDLCPGTLMLAASLKLAIEEGYRQFDFLRGDEPYKATWNAQSIPLASLRIAGRSPAARVRHSAWRTRETVKHWIRQRLPSGVSRPEPVPPAESN
jgi:CelD/BcsL family acetyltransferase involved in cellulose biosynthesis